MGLPVSHPRAAGARRILGPALVALSALSLITCAEDPIGPASGEARLRVVPVFPANARVAPLAIDRVRVLVQRVINSEEIGETVVDDTIPFALDRDQLTIRDIRLRMSEPTEDFQVTIELLANNTLLFQGSQIMVAIRGRTSDPTEVGLVYAGPGANVASLLLAPRDTTLDLGATFSFRLDAFDGQGLPVPQYYVHWGLVDAPPLGARITAAGTVTTPSARDTFYVKVVNIPTGVMDSTRVIVAPPAAPPPITVIPTPLAAGDQHTCEIRTAGSYCWGGNLLGKLGDGTNTDRLVPTRVAGGQTFVAVSAGNSHTCALTAQGQAFCWGDNSTGALGDGSNTNHNTPTAVAGSFTFAQIAAANQFTCAITLQGQGLCWGANFDGQLGDGTTTDRNAPTAVAGTHLFIRISAAGMFDTSSDHACAIDATGQAWCWGVNNQGQLGTGNLTDSPVPVAVTGGLTFAEISLGNESSCALGATGQGFCWGFNFGAQLTAPTPVAGGFTYSAIDMGANHVCGKTGTGWLCGGDGGAGQLGDGTSTDHQTPVAPSGGLSFSVMAAGGLHTCGVTANGTYCWGSDNGGQLGTGDVTRTSQPTPVPVVGAPASLAIVSGNSQTAPSLSAVANPLVVRVADGTGGGIPGVEVIFTVAAGGGTLDGLPSVTLLTDANGNASAFDWTMGPTPGPNQVTATVSALAVAGNPVTFTATGTATGPVTLTWAGSASTDWSNAGNWNPAQVPGPTDSVVIGATAQFQPTLTADVVTGAVNIISGGRLTIGPHGLGTLRGFATGGSGVLVMQDAGSVVSVGGDAVFDGGNELNLLSAGGLSVGGNLTQRATNSGDSFHPSGSHVTILTGAGPTLSFATPGVVPGTSHFQELVWVGAGTLTLSTPVMAHGTLTLTSQTTSTFATPNGSRLTVGNVTVVPGTPLVFNGVPLTLSQATVGPLTLFNTTFQGMATNVSQLVVSHPGGGTSYIFSNLVFSTTPVAPNGFYIDVTDVTGPTDGGLTIDLTTPTPASPGAFARASNGAIVNWPAGAPAVITWTGAVSTDWNATGNWNPARLPTSGDSVVIPNAVTNFPTLTGRAVVGAMFEDGRLTINGGALEVLRSTTSNAGINRIITLTGTTDSLIVHGNLGTPTSGTGGVVVLGGDITAGVNFSNLRFVVDGSGAQSITGSGVSNTQIGVTIVDKPAGAVTFGSFLYTGDSIAVLQGTLAGSPTFQLTRGFSSATGTTVTLTGGTLQVGTTINAQGSYAVTNTAFNLQASPAVLALPILPYTNLSVTGTSSLSGSLAQLTARTVVTGSFTFTGTGGSPVSTFSLNGHTLVVNGSLTTTGLGQARIGMTNPLDSLIVAGNASFGSAIGGNPGNLSAGTLVVGGDFLMTNQFGGANFQATGTHTTVLTSNNPTVTFFLPGTTTGGNRFQNLTWTGTGTMTLGDTATIVSGTLTTTAAAPVTFLSNLANGGRLQFRAIAAGGAVTFSKVPVWAVQTGTGGAIGLGNATFTGMPTTLAQLTIQHPGVVGGLTLPSLTFNTLPTSGVYVSATDNNTIDPTALVVNLTTPTPATSGGFFLQVNSTINWGFASITWTGNLSTNWSTAGNWSGGVVPTAIDSVVIPTTTNQPGLTAATSVGAVQITGGTLTLAGQTLTVARSFITTGTGTLTSNTAASLLVVAGNALFGGGDETGLLTDGNLRVAGNFTQGTTANSFVASGSHTTFLNGTGAQTVTIANGGPASSRFQNLRVSNGTGVVTLSGTTPELVVSGTLTVATGGTLTGPTAVTTPSVVTSTGSTLSVFLLTVPAAGLTVAGSYGVNATILTGGGTVPVLTYTNLRLTGAAGYTLGANVATAGYLDLQSELTVAGHTVTVGGDFLTTGTGILTMTNAADLVTVAGSTSFYGGDETGKLTAGILRTSNQFLQDALTSPASFVAEGTHTVEIVSQNPTGGVVNFGTPAVSHFRNLRVLFISTIVSDVVVSGNLEVNFNVAGNLFARRVTVGGSFTQSGIGFFGPTRLTLLGSNLVTAGTLGPDTLEFAGTAPQTYPDLNFTSGRTVLVANDVTAPTGFTGILNNLEIQTGGIFRLGTAGNTFNVGGTLRTAGTGVLVMTSPSTQMTADSAVFSGGDETGLLTDGVLTVTRALVQLPTNSPSSFVASGNHQVDLTGATVNVDFDFFTRDQSPINNLTSSAGNTFISWARVNGNATFSGNNVNASTLNIRGTLTTAPATGLGIDSLILGGPLAAGNGYVAANHYIFDQATGTQVVPGSSANLPYNLGDITIRSNAQAGGTITTNGLRIDGSTGRFALNGNTVNVSGPFATSGSGVLVSTIPADALLITGNATFDGGDETGLLTAGAIRITGNMTQSATNSPNSFRATGTHSAILSGTGTTQIAFATPGSRFQNLLVDMPGGTAAVTAGSVIVGGNLQVNQGQLALNGHRVDVLGNFSTNTTGTLAMQNAADSLLVTGAALFAGASTNGLLTAGVLRASGDFTQSAVVSTLSFAPSGNHTTALVSTSNHVADIGSPGSGAAGSHFQNLDLSGATGGVTLTVNSIADGTLISSGSGRLNGGGSSLTVRQVQVTGMIADNTSIIVDEGGTARGQQFDNVTFQNLPATGALPLSVTGVGASLAPRVLTFNSVNFPTLATGAGNLYAQLTSSNGQGLTLRMLGSNHGIGALGDGPLLSDPANQLTVLGATILWQ